jgi:hypothetical protein
MPEYPKEFFNAEIKAFENIKFENRAASYVSVSRVDISYTEPHPWDEEISKLLQPLTRVNWNEGDIWQNRIRGRLNKLVHKLDALQYHSDLFKHFERMTEEEWKTNIVGNTTMNYSDLEGLSCFLIQRSKEGDKVATIYYPAMTDGQRVSKYMDKSWNNIYALIQGCASPLVNAAVKGTQRTSP